MARMTLKKGSAQSSGAVPISWTDLKGSLRNSLGYFQTMRGRVKSLLNGRKKRTKNWTAS